MGILRHWPTAMYVFYLCLMAPTVLACEAILKLSAVPDFVERGSLGSKDTYVQRVYSGNSMSYSTIMFSLNTAFDEKALLRETAKGMISTVSGKNKGSYPQVQILNKALLPELDSRLAFLSYITHGIKGSINVEASASIRTDTCWSVLRFSAFKKQTSDEALNRFANLIRATILIN